MYSFPVTDGRAVVRAARGEGAHVARVGAAGGRPAQPPHPLHHRRAQTAQYHRYGTSVCAYAYFNIISYEVQRIFIAPQSI